MELLKEERILRCDRNIFQVVEDDGVHYFALQPDDPNDAYIENLLVATDGKKIIGEPFEHSPYSSLSDTSFDKTPRIVVAGSSVYLKADYNIIAIDRSLNKASLEKPYTIVDKNENEITCIPSNHCVDPYSTLWAVTQLKGEPVQSIKGYRRGERKGENGFSRLSRKLSWRLGSTKNHGNKQRWNTGLFGRGRKYDTFLSNIG
jgi:hypothetical protein